jgi:hypothetical protein
MTSADIPAGLALCRQSGWNQTARDWNLLLTLAPDGAFVAELDGAVAGTVHRCALQSGVRLGRDDARTGVAAWARDRARANEPCAREIVRDGGLDATAAGRVLYVTLGFEDEFTLTRWRGASA